MVQPLLLAAILSATAAPTSSVAALDWLEGHWRTEGARPANEPRFTEEVWLAGMAGKMFGIGRTIQGRRTASFEYMRIEEAESGLVFIAQPNGAPPTRFTMISHGLSQIVFENRATDYPQRVTYRRDGERLTATISLADGSKATSWTFRRIPRK